LEVVLEGAREQKSCAGKVRSPQGRGQKLTMTASRQG